MKRREFIKAVTATVALTAIPVTLAAAITKPADIIWYVEQNPCYGYAWQVMAEIEINGRKFMASEIVEENAEKTMIDKAKRSIMYTIERELKHG